MTIEVKTPIASTTIDQLKVGDIISITGWIFTGRDAVLPKVEKAINDGSFNSMGINIEGGVIFHTAVSPAGVGPTSSNKKEIEESFAPLSKAGIKLFLGKGEISKQTIEAIDRNGAVFAVIPPTTALFEDQTKERRIIGWPELGMEALHAIYVDGYQAIIAAAHGKSIYDRHE